jgi:uncharacterized protein (DUF1501 family)
MTDAKKSAERNALSRRSLFAAGWAALAGSTLAGATPLASQQSAPDSAVPLARPRTLVCVYLLGGSDGNSLIAPLDPSQYAGWDSARGELGLRADALLPVKARSGSAYGLHPALPELQKYFVSGAAAVVANVGPQSRPPAANPSGRYAALAFLSDGYLTLDWAARKAAQGPGSNEAFTLGNGVSLVAIGKSRFEGERRKNPALLQKIAAAEFRTSFPASPAGRQMRNVAGLLKAGNVTGAPAQMIFCPIGGFESSTAQSIMKAPAYRDLSLSISALYEATLEMKAADSVTIFTDSEFGRTLRPNTKHGADPGWGNHHFVLGGAVRGGDLFGRYPDMSAGPFDSDSALIPTTSSARYYATLASWLGVRSEELPSLLPDLDGASALNLFQS